MSQDPNHDVHLLTGAYALDALDDEERTAFEDHLDWCEPCAAEVAELQATATRLAELTRATPSPQLRVQVLDAIDRTRQDRPPAAPGRDEPADGGDELAARRDRTGVPRWLTPLVATAAGIAVVAVLGLSALLSGLDGRLAELEVATDRIGERVAATDRVTAVLAAPDAQLHDVSGPDGTTARVVVSPTRGEAVFLASGMEPAPHAHVYELWVIGESGPVPAGLFDADDTGRATHVLTGDLAGADAIGVTIEPEGGSPEPSAEPIMVAEL